MTPGQVSAEQIGEALGLGPQLTLILLLGREVPL